MLVTGERRQRLGDLAAGTGVARALPVRHRSLAAAAVALVVLVLLGLSFYQATGDDDVSGPKAEPTATPETLAVREGEIFFQDDFSDPTSGWGTGVIEEGEVGYVEGAYRIFAKAERQVFGDLEVSPRVQGLRLEFEATQLAGTSGDLVGARCYTDVGSNVGYILESHRPSRAISSPHSGEMTSGSSSPRGRGSRPSGPRARRTSCESSASPRPMPRSS
jgi:hypothetical protein